MEDTVFLPVSELCFEGNLQSFLVSQSQAIIKLYQSQILTALTLLTTQKPREWCPGLEAETVHGRLEADEERMNEMVGRDGLPRDRTRGEPTIHCPC